MPLKRRSTSRMIIISDSHYDGLRATDGTDISTRAKHRAYMKEHDLTTVDDYAETWKQAEQKRTKALSGEADKADRHRSIREALERHYGKP